MSTQRPGRPQVGKPVHLRLPEDVLDGVDELASEADVSRAEMVRRLLVEALAQAPQARDQRELD